MLADAVGSSATFTNPPEIASLTKPSTSDARGYTVEFNLQDRLVDGNGIYGYASSNNVQGTSSQKFPVKNLKVYLAKGESGQELIDESVNILTANATSITTAATTAYMSVHSNAESVAEYITECAAAIQEVIDNNSSITQ